MPGQEEGKYLTVKEVASLLGFHPETIKRWAREGKISVLQIGHYGHLRIKWPLEKSSKSYKVQQKAD